MITLFARGKKNNDFFCETIATLLLVEDEDEPILFFHEQIQKNERLQKTFRSTHVLILFENNILHGKYHDTDISVCVKN